MNPGSFSCVLAFRVCPPEHVLLAFRHAQETFCTMKHDLLDFDQEDDLEELWPGASLRILAIGGNCRKRGIDITFFVGALWYPVMKKSIFLSYILNLSKPTIFITALQENRPPRCSRVVSADLTRKRRRRQADRMEILHAILCTTKA